MSDGKDSVCLVVAHRIPPKGASHRSGRGRFGHPAPGCEESGSGENDLTRSHGWRMRKLVAKVGTGRDIFSNEEFRWPVDAVHGRTDIGRILTEELFRLPMQSRV